MKFKEWLLMKENFNDTDLEFEAKITAPKAIEYTVFKQNQPVVNGVALANSNRKSRSFEFFITAPQLGINSYENIKGLNGPYAKFIYDHLIQLYDATIASFRMKGTE